MTTDNTKIAAGARTRLRDLAAKLVAGTGDPLLVADLFLECAVAVTLTDIEPSELARVMRLRADDIEALGEGARYDG